MITHVVQWKVKDQALGLDKAGILEKLKQDLENLCNEIPEIISLQVGLNAKAADAASDVVLLSTFADWEALERYQQHPAHQEVVGFVREIAVERRVVDFED
ncbi:MAG: Dabb family protein [Kiritimatiellia bacterium]